MLEGKKNLTNFENLEGENFFLKSWKEEKKKRIVELRPTVVVVVKNNSVNFFIKYQKNVITQIEKTTPGNLVFIFFSSECGLGKLSKKRVSPFRQNLGYRSRKVVLSQYCKTGTYQASCRGILQVFWHLYIVLWIKPKFDLNIISL